jgi:hypothetical protein
VISGDPLKAGSYGNTSGRLLVELLAHVLVTVGGIVTYASVQLKRLV